MHDPKTVAHDIRYPWKNKHGYRNSIITIWHVDPEKGALGCKSDDSCGWFAPPYTEEEKESVLKLAKNQYEQLFAKQVAYAEEKTFAYICYNQDCYGALYWLWRALKSMGNNGWQYGKRLSAKELDKIYRLATNPVDNLQHSYLEIKTYENFERFFMLVWRSFRSFNRPWYKHPRWHIWHWEIQFHPWQNFKRRYLDRCSECGKRGFKTTAYGDWDGTKIWCSDCNENKYK